MKSNWGNPFTAKDVKWTWGRKFNLKGQGLFQTAVLGLHTPDQIKIEGDHAISFNLDKPNPILLKQQCNLANPIYDGTKRAEAGGKDDPWAVQFLKNESAGFGRYRLKQLVRGQWAVFEARDDYWGEKPAMKRVIMKEVPTLVEPALPAAGRRGRHCAVPSAARTAGAQGGQRGRGRRRQRLLCDLARA